METPETVPRVGVPPEYYYDSLTSTFLLGKVAMEAHVESGGHPADLISLKDMLLDKNYPHALPQDSIIESFSKEQAVINGRWLMSIINDNGQSHSLTARRLETAYRLGLNYSPHQIRSPRNFRTIVEYQEALGSKNFHRRSHFDEMTLDDLADHVRKVSQEEGQKATIEVFNRRISEGRDEPTPRIIRRLIKRVDPSLTLHDLYDMAGHSETTQHWSNERYELWGEEYLWANKGRFPSANALNEFAKKRKGPSQNGVRNRYQTINSYHDSLEARFSTHFDQYLDEVATGIIENRLPIDLIANTKSEWVVAKRYIKYSLLEKLYPDLTTLEKVNLIPLMKDGYNHRLASTLPDIDVSKLEQEARIIGVYAAIWPKKSGMVRHEARKSTARQFTAETGKLDEISRRGISGKKVKRSTVGNVPVLDTKLLANGYVLKVLAPSPRTEPVIPDSEQAKAIVKRVKATRTKQKYTIYSAILD